MVKVWQAEYEMVPRYPIWLQVRFGDFFGLEMDAK